MQSLNKYLLLGLVAISAILLICCLSLKNSRDDAVNSLDRANDQLNQLINANVNLKGAIDLLEQQTQQNRKYITDLESRKTESVEQANKLSQEFKTKRHENQSISDWANTKLPGDLY